MKDNIVENLVWIIFFSVGMIFFIIGIVICTNLFNYENKIDTEGIITQISYSSNSDSHDVYVEYMVNEKKYESELNTYSSSFYEGKEIEIYYDKDNPSKIGVKKLDLIFLIFPGMGLLFIIIGGIGIFSKVIYIGKSNRLKENGEIVYADYVETIINTVYSVNGRHPYKIICEWVNPEDGETYIFKSVNLWKDPEIIIIDRNIDKFPVYINPLNKKQYVVDVDILTDN